MQISVVIPTYRRPGLLLKCLHALVTQQFNGDHYEIIVVSDGPDELTNNMFNNRTGLKQHRVHYYHLPEKKGPAAARNYGWLLAKGELIAFTDDDCIPDKYWLQNLWNNYTPGSNVALAGRTIVPLPHKPTDYERNISQLETADFITANCCCSKITLQTIGGFDEDFRMAWREDSDLQFKLLKENISIIRVNNACVIHPIRKVKWGISIKEQKKTMFNVLLYKKYPDLYRQKIQRMPPFQYYTIIVSFLVMLAGFTLHLNLLFVAGWLVWLGFTLAFTAKRLQNTTLEFDHVLEMFVTSFIIPFLSIYWQAYGSFKYKALLI